MLKYAKVYIGYKGNYSYKKRFDYYKPALSSKVAFLNKTRATGNVSNFDCDVTQINDNCLTSFVYIEDTPMFIEICKNCEVDYCSIYTERS